ncbi:hypothetical protein RMSM_00278 [Rhodopirellula maiorica SM1]|uniref:Uncharacterized protein n=1 Tax=Rhodopirellula maiorica SM1 TaxID=1265738 RepID=M5RTY9_9BACT|nr:hypothetical protein RMSM_00278 [Rhodopirellula maiorica SM1]
MLQTASVMCFNLSHRDSFCATVNPSIDDESILYVKCGLKSYRVSL